MKLKELTKLLSEKDQEWEVEYMVVDKATSAIVSMNITDETADLMKLLKAFRPKKKAHNAALTGGEAVRVEGTVMQQTEDK